MERVVAKPMINNATNAKLERYQSVRSEGRPIAISQARQTGRKTRGDSCPIHEFTPEGARNVTRKMLGRKFSERHNVRPELASTANSLRNGDRPQRD